ncbi:LOB domain-containing protein 2-like [Hibiscus syriacus]|uniref:LOB domain-containing protein 2-like n=1 Tax=Hibiscus syriacus TaxID=106335 RepID=UPI001923BBA0|nr:LOB domain-containing protein 2-like [Hibiscus syriacus]
MQRDTTSNGTAAAATRVHPACAACKHQRKKCDENCILAPYFPADKCREFQAVHKVFGVSNATKIVRNASTDEDRKKVAYSLIWEAFCWQKDPVLGPYGDYRKVYDELSLYKKQSQMMILKDHDHHQPGHQVFKMGAAHTVAPTKRGDTTLRCYNPVDANSLFGFSGYPYPQSDKAVQEKGMHNTTIVPLQYYASADVGFMNGKTLESTGWDNIL